MTGEEIVEIMAEHAHNEWMAASAALGITSRLSHWGEEQMVPYDELSERCQEFDKVIMRGILHGFTLKGLQVTQVGAP